MAYRTYKNLQEVAKKYQVRLDIAPFLEPMPVVVDEHFRADLDYTQQHIDVRASEAAISEFLIAPLLKEAWKPYADYLLLWSHVALRVGDEFDGFPDYLFTKRTELGMVRDKPYLFVVEAKKDDFEGGWGQCLHAMLAAQTINEDDSLILYGTVSSGDVWEFGKLQYKKFVRDQRSFTIADLASVLAALNAIFYAAKRQTL